MDVGQLFSESVEVLNGTSGTPTVEAYRPAATVAAMKMRENNAAEGMDDRAFTDADVVAMLAVAVVYGTGSFPLQVVGDEAGRYTDLSTNTAPQAPLASVPHNVLAYVSTRPANDQRSRSLVIAWDQILSNESREVVLPDAASDGEGTRVPSPNAVQSAVVLMKTVSRERVLEKSKHEQRQATDATQQYRSPILKQNASVAINQQPVDETDACSLAGVTLRNFSDINDIALARQESSISKDEAPGSATAIALDDRNELAFILDYNGLEKLTALTGAPLPDYDNSSILPLDHRFAEDDDPVYDAVAPYRTAFVALQLSAYGEYLLHEIAYSPTENGGTREFIERITGAGNPRSIGPSFIRAALIPSGQGFRCDLATGTPPFYGEYVFYATVYFLMAFWAVQKLSFSRGRADPAEDVYRAEMAKLSAMLDRVDQPIRLAVYRRACYIFWATMVGGDERMKIQGTPISEVIDASFPRDPTAAVTSPTFTKLAEQMERNIIKSSTRYLVHIIIALAEAHVDYSSRELDRMNAAPSPTGQTSRQITDLPTWATLETDQGLPWERFFIFAADACGQQTDQFQEDGRPRLSFPARSLFATPVSAASMRSRVERIVYAGIGCGGRDENDVDDLMGEDTVKSFDGDIGQPGSPESFIEDAARFIAAELLIHALGDAAEVVKATLVGAASNRILFQARTARGEDDEDDMADVVGEGEVDGSGVAVEGLASRTSAYARRSAAMYSALEGARRAEAILSAASAFQESSRSPDTVQAQSTVWHLPFGVEMDITASFSILGPSVGLTQCKWTVNYARTPFRGREGDIPPATITECAMYCTGESGVAVTHGLAISCVIDPRMGRPTEKKHAMIEASCTRYQTLGGTCVATSERICMKVLMPENTILAFRLLEPRIERPA